ncbi:MAG: hypothetical protein AAF362_09565, partial [Pseudomonadota bacterium]
MIRIATISLAIAVCFSRIRRQRAIAINVMLTFLIASGLASFGNILAILSEGKANESVYFLYTVPEYILQASIIHYVG